MMCRSAPAGSAKHLQQRTGGLGAEPDRVGADRGGGLQQWPVEQLLVQPPDLARVPGPLRGEPLDRAGPGVAAVAERLGEPAQPVLVVRIRQPVGAAQPLELKSVLDLAQEPVRLGQCLAVGAADVAAVGERLERVERAAGAQRRVAPAVHELEQLDRELDVPQPAPAELDLAVGVPGGQALLDPAPHRADVVHHAGAVDGLPHQRRDDGHPLRGEGPVAGDRASLE
jgi:hypothetical protein